MTPTTPTDSVLKARARRLRDTLRDRGNPITHAEALEAVARQHGYRDWNTALAAVRREHPPNWQVGQKVRGHYLSQPFTGRIKAAGENAGGFWKLTLVFDTPVDVVTSPRFSNLRRQVSCVVDAHGKTSGKTSDGVPHMVLSAA